MITNKNTEQKKLILKIPGSSANLGPGFDTFALALQIYCKLEFSINDSETYSKHPLIILEGDHLQKSLDSDSENLVYILLKKYWQNTQSLLDRLKIKINSEIPLSRGLGSSAAATIGAIWAANYFAPENKKITKQEILSLASEEEGHSDNVSASLLGSFTLSAVSKLAKETTVTCKKINWPKNWKTIVSVPSYELSTKKAREVIPKTINHKDAVHNLQCSSMLVTAVLTEDNLLMKEALSEDLLHEPYREHLIPELKQIKNLLKDEDTLGTVISGAGSSILTIVENKHKNAVINQLNQWNKEQEPDQKLRILDLDIDNEGIQTLDYE